MVMESEGQMVKGFNISGPLSRRAELNRPFP